MEKLHNNFEIAMDAREKGLVAIPCHAGQKIPALRTWKEWQTSMPPVDLQREWFREQCNIALITSGMVVFDCDDPEKVQVVLENCGDTPHKLRSPSGGLHLGFRKRKGVVVTNQVKIKGMPIDIRTDGGLELIPRSETEKGRYEWLGEGLRPVADLPLAKIGWTRERSKKKPTTVMPEEAEPGTLLYRGQAYVDRFEKAESGRGGHRTLYIAALKIVSFVRRLGGTEQDAWQLLLYYNARCIPPWDLAVPADERALIHKFEEAWKKAR